LLMKSTRLEWINSTEEDGRKWIYIECRPGLNYSFFLSSRKVLCLSQSRALSRRLRVCGPVTMRRHATRFRFNFSNMMELRETDVCS
jgi:hypothetical protein